MKAIVLAAGKGSRISDKIDGVPKSTLKLTDGTPIIRKTIKNMISFGIQPVVCVGYRKKDIFEALEGLDVIYYDNPFFSITNNIVSLWFARNEFKNEDIVLTSADLYYPDSFLSRLMEADGMISMVADSSRIESGDFYLSVGREGYINEYGPNIPLKKRTYEYMGLTKIDKSIAHAVKSKIEEYIENGDFDKYFEDMIIGLNMSGHYNIDFIDVKGFFWREFDRYEDYMSILEYERGNG